MDHFPDGHDVAAAGEGWDDGDDNGVATDTGAAAGLPLPLLRLCVVTVYWLTSWGMYWAMAACMTATWPGEK